jgi:hypothetical protein
MLRKFALIKSQTFFNVCIKKIMSFFRGVKNGENHWVFTR